MVEVCVGEDDRLDRRRIDGEGVPVAGPDLARSLEQSAVDEEEPGSGSLVGRFVGGFVGGPAGSWAGSRAMPTSMRVFDPVTVPAPPMKVRNMIQM